MKALEVRVFDLERRVLELESLLEKLTKVSNTPSVPAPLPPANQEPVSSNVDHPSHYNKGRIEVALAMDLLWSPEQWLGHALKYACRAPWKGKEDEDVAKAIWCARRAVSVAEGSLNDHLFFERVSFRWAISDGLIAGISNTTDQGKALREFITALIVKPSEASNETFADGLTKAANRLEFAYSGRK